MYLYELKIVKTILHYFTFLVPKVIDPRLS